MVLTGFPDLNRCVDAGMLSRRHVFVELLLLSNSFKFLILYLSVSVMVALASLLFSSSCLCQMVCGKIVK